MNLYIGLYTYYVMMNNIQYVYHVFYESCSSNDAVLIGAFLTEDEALLYGWKKVLASYAHWDKLENGCNTLRFLVNNCEVWKWNFGTQKKECGKILNGHHIFAKYKTDIYQLIEQLENNVLDEKLINATHDIVEPI